MYYLIITKKKKTSLINGSHQLCDPWIAQLRLFISAFRPRYMNQIYITSRKTAQAYNLGQTRDDKVIGHKIAEQSLGIIRHTV